MVAEWGLVLCVLAIFVGWAECWDYALDFKGQGACTVLYAGTRFVLQSVTACKECDVLGKKKRGVSQRMP